MVDINGPLTRGGPTAQSQKPFDLKKFHVMNFKRFFFYNWMYFLELLQRIFEHVCRRVVFFAGGGVIASHLSLFLDS